MLMRYGSIFLAGHLLWTGVAISLIAFFLAMHTFARWGNGNFDPNTESAGVALLAAYPFSFFYSAAYTESLFLLAAVAACFHVERDELWKAGAWGLIAGLSRPNGCLLSIVLALLMVSGQRSTSWRRLSWRALADRAAIAATPGIGMLVFSTYIFVSDRSPSAVGGPERSLGPCLPWDWCAGSDHLRFVQQHGLYRIRFDAHP